MKLHKSFDSLCSPARIYLGLSVLVLSLLLVQNVFNANIHELCVGSFKCKFPHIILLFVSQIIYVGFWTWLLNFLCQKGLKTLSWFIIVIPFLLSAIGMAAIIYNFLVSAPHAHKHKVTYS
jgi:hypothetical protein